MTTPTLVMHGELDLCVPLTQGQELYDALAAEGVDTELIIYPREGHGWRSGRTIVAARACEPGSTATSALA